MSLEKIHRDSKQLVKGGSRQPSVKFLQQRVGVKPSLQDCLDGLMILYEMHHSEYATSLSGKTTFFLADALFVDWRYLILGEMLEVFNEQSGQRLNISTLCCPGSCSSLQGQGCSISMNKANCKPVSKLGRRLFIHVVIQLE